MSFNGVEFSYGELRDRLERDEDQELNRKAHRMAIAGQQMDMAEQFATNIVVASVASGALSGAAAGAMIAAMSGAGAATMGLAIAVGAVGGAIMGYVTASKAQREEAGNAARREEAEPTR